MEERQNAEIVGVSDIKRIVALSMLLVIASGCESQMPVVTSTPSKQEVVEPTLSSTGERRLLAAKAEPAPVAKEPNQHWPKITSVTRNAMHNPFTGKDETEWHIIYRYGPGDFNYSWVTIRADKLTDELVQQAIMQEMERRKKAEAEEAEARKRFEGKEY